MLNTVILWGYWNSLTSKFFTFLFHRMMISTVQQVSCLVQWIGLTLWWVLERATAKYAAIWSLHLFLYSSFFIIYSVGWQVHKTCGRACIKKYDYHYQLLSGITFNVMDSGLVWGKWPEIIVSLCKYIILYELAFMLIKPFQMYVILVKTQLLRHTRVTSAQMRVQPYTWK